jgi:hypothetical protein
MYKHSQKGEEKYVTRGKRVTELVFPNVGKKAEVDDEHFRGHDGL